MTWIEYNEQVFKLIKFFGGDLYQKKNIEEGWALWRTIDKAILHSAVEFSIFQNKPIDLKQEALRCKPQKKQSYLNPDDYVFKDYDPDYLSKLLKENESSSLWDLVQKFKESSCQNK